MITRYEPDRAKGIDDELKKHYDSGRRKVIERQNRESITRPIKVTMEEVMLRIEKLQIAVDAYVLELAENQKRIIQLLEDKQ